MSVLSSEKPSVTGAGHTVVLASNNSGKLNEFAAILSSVGVHMVAQADMGVSAAEEPYGTFVENALAKARHASQQTGLPALADDSGLCVPVLGGQPGVHSARFAALAGGQRSDAANNAHLVSRLQGHHDRRGIYVAVLVYLDRADDPLPLIAQGQWHGQLLESPRGCHGFGYDPLFYLPEYGKTVAELSPQEKNRLSHRAQALQALVSMLAVRVAPV